MMSKKMGLSYLTPSVIDWHLADYTRNYVVLPGGTKSALPRYFGDRLYNCSDVATRELVKTVRAPILDASVRISASKVYKDHISLYGNADNFIKMQNDARHSAIRNYQKKASGRSDL